MKVLLAWKGPRDARERVMYSRRQVPLLRQLAADGVHPIVALLGDPGGMRHDLEGSGIAVAVLPILPPPTSALVALPRAMAVAVPVLRATGDLAFLRLEMRRYPSGDEPVA